MFLLQVENNLLKKSRRQFNLQQRNLVALQCLRWVVYVQQRFSKLQQFVARIVLLHLYVMP